MGPQPWPAVPEFKGDGPRPWSPGSSGSSSTRTREAQVAARYASSGDAPQFAEFLASQRDPESPNFRGPVQMQTTTATATDHRGQPRTVQLGVWREQDGTNAKRQGEWRVGEVEAQQQGGYAPVAAGSHRLDPMTLHRGMAISKGQGVNSSALQTALRNVALPLEAGLAPKEAALFGPAKKIPKQQANALGDPVSVGYKSARMALPGNRDLQIGVGYDVKGNPVIGQLGFDSSDTGRNQPKFITPRGLKGPNGDNRAQAPLVPYQRLRPETLGIITADLKRQFPQTAGSNYSTMNMPAYAGIDISTVAQLPVLPDASARASDGPRMENTTRQAPAQSSPGAQFGVGGPPPPPVSPPIQRHPAVARSTVLAAFGGTPRVSSTTGKQGHSDPAHIFKDLDKPVEKSEHARRLEEVKGYGDFAGDMGNSPEYQQPGG